MRKVLTSPLRRLRGGWFWPLVLLALPNCALQTEGTRQSVLIRGPVPQGDAVMCDIEKFQGRHCATPDELTVGVRLTEAGIALVQGQQSAIGLDDSPAALARCANQPEAVPFDGQFPNGYAACINCGAVIPAPYADANAVCVAQCQDLVAIDSPVPPDAAAYCAAHAHVSTNFPIHGCFNGACSDGATLRPDFVDPRRFLEPVAWQNLVGTSAVGSNLSRTAPATGMFDAGASSTQLITHGDAYVEFEASENNTSHVLGFALGASDSDPGIADIGFAISLNLDGRFYVLEGGNLIPGADLNMSFGTYTAGERFRVRLQDDQDGTALITYTRVNGPCQVGAPCPDTLIYTHAGPGVAYPFRVDASFREQPATLANVGLARIQ